jgi:hypothetical protein
MPATTAATIAATIRVTSTRDLEAMVVSLNQQRTDDKGHCGQEESRLNLDGKNQD